MPPAARMGDMTAHGGAIVLGCPTVLIGGMPAARLSDMHMCPMVTPGLPPIPHVGGPVTLGSPMVLIGGMPAARMGDMLVCVGPPDSIMMGCLTVLIGEGGSGSASSSGGGGGGAGGTGTAKGGGGGAGTSSASSSQRSGPSSAAPMAAGALMAQSGNQESDTKWEHWVEFVFVDKAGKPLSGIQYALSTPDGKHSSGILQSNGRVTRDALPVGTCTIELQAVHSARWEKDRAQAGETVKWSAKVDGYKDTTPAQWTVFRRDLSGPDTPVQKLQTEVRGEKVEGNWVYAIKSQEPSKPEKGDKQKVVKVSGPQSFSAPEYYFEVAVGSCRARSGLLSPTAKADLQFLDHQGKPLSNVKYRIRTGSGEIRTGTLDGQGKALLENLPPGQFSVTFEKKSTYKKLSRKSQ
jgi:uncharacterized Zn-binding protein involved in type VI secretion